MKDASFIHLSVHSHFSFLRGGSSPEDLCAQAAKGGMKSIALTDVNGLYGAVPFLRAAEKHGLHPILGVDLREPVPGDVGLRREALESSRSRRGFIEETPPARRALLLAQTPAGYSEVCRLVTARHLRGEFDLLEALKGRAGGVAVITSDVGLLADLTEGRGGSGHYLALPAWRPWRRLAARAAEGGLFDAGVEPVATGEVWFARPWDHWRHHLLTAIGLNAALSGVPSALVAPSSAWLQDPSAMARLFQDLPEAVRNAGMLAASCEGGPALGGLHLPAFPLSDIEETRGGVLQHLREQCLRGIVWRYGTRTEPRATTGQIYPADDPWCPRPGEAASTEPPDPSDLREDVVRQLEHELSIIQEMGYAGYFLVVADIVRFARTEGIPTCGRGSAANSVVAYTLGLTHVDPLAHDLYFERFLNQGRSDAPDVDLDFSWRDRDRVLEYVYRRYGSERVAMIATQVTFQARAAVREVAKVHGLPEGEIAEVTKRLGYYTGARELREKIASNPRFRGIDLTEDPWRTVMEAAEQLDGYPRHLGLHPGGIVIAPGPITDIVPLERTAKGLIATQWDMYPVEDAGLVKIDLLGNRSLAVIDDACADIASQHDREISYVHFDPTQDEATQSLIRTGDTVGCFYVESPATRGLLRKLDCSDFETLVAASSIIRPGVSSSGMMGAYIERYHGAPFTYLHPKMEEILGGTFGVMCYQEDVIKVAHHVAGMSLVDADGLRKSMSKKRNYEKIEAYRVQFTEGAAARGASEDVAAELWRQIESFGGYSFCKAHSASYALVSFQSAWLRAHYPAEFIAAVLSNYGGFYTTFAYISEAVRMGLELLGPDVNESRVAYTGYTYGADEGDRTVGVGTEAEDSTPRPGGPAASGLQEGVTQDGTFRGWLRVGLCQVRGLSEESAKAIVAARQRGGPFGGFDDLAGRVPLRASELEVLIRCGALDSLEDGTRPELMWRALRRERAGAGSISVGSAGREVSTGSAAPRRTGRRPRAGEPLRLPLEMPEGEAPPRALDYDEHTLLAFEAEALGFLVSAHPLALYETDIERARRMVGPPMIEGRDLEAHVGKRVRLVGWMVTAKPIHTASDEVMEFISFEDTTALYEVTVFPGAYRRYAGQLLTRGPFVLTGRVEQEWGAISVTLDRLHVLGRGDLPRPGRGRAGQRSSVAAAASQATSNRR